MTLKQISVLAMVTLLLACAQRPEDEVEAARQALEEARTAEAPVYAPEEFEAAEENLREAEAEIAAQDDGFALNRSYDRASELLAQARTAAEEAASAATIRKEETSSQAEVALQEAEQSIESAAEALSGAPRGKGSAADVEALEVNLERSRSSLDQARQLFQDGNFMDAFNEARTAQSRAETISSEVEQAIQRTGGR